MNEGPNVKGNPLRIAASLLVVSYVIGEFIIPKYSLIFFLNRFHMSSSGLPYFLKIKILFK